MVLRASFRKREQEAPCILFIDEIHNLPLQTKEGAGETLTQFLTMTESLLAESIIVLAATNRAYMLDDALLKPGRFGLVINFEEPTFENRKKFFEVYFKENAISADNFDIDALARQTRGSSYGDLVALFKNAKFAAHHGSRTVTQTDFQNRIYRQLYRIQLDRKLPLNNDERALVAVHQAGHALTHLLFEPEMQEILECVTIKGKWRKIVEIRFFDTKSREEHSKKKTKYGHIISLKKSEILNIKTDPVIRCKILLAGHLAEKILFGSSSYAYHEKDKKKALSLMEEVAFDGLKKEDYTKEEQKVRMQIALNDVKKYEQEVYDLLLKHRTLLKILHLNSNKKSSLLQKK